MRAGFGKMAMGAVLLAGCTAMQSSGVMSLGSEGYAVTVASRRLGAAAEKALTEATDFCNSQGQQTQLLRTQINSADYGLEFRCVTAGSWPGGPGGPAMVSAPVLSGPAFGTPSQPPAERPPGQGFAVAAPSGRSGLPAEPPTLAALAAAAAVPADPGRNSAFAPLPPLGVGGPGALGGSGVAATPDPRPHGEPVFAPLPASALVPPPPAYPGLPPVTGQPGGVRQVVPPRQPLAARGAADLPPPGMAAAGQAGTIAGSSASAVPPPGFWELRR